MEILVELRGFETRVLPFIDFSGALPAAGYVVFCLSAPFCALMPPFAVMGFEVYLILSSVTTCRGVC